MPLSGEDLSARFDSVGASVLGSPLFDIFIIVVILLNAASIAVEQSIEIAGGDISYMIVLEHLFLLVYMTELLLRLKVQGITCFRENWIKFDAIIVAFGIFTNWIAEPFLSSGDFSRFVMLRAMRLLRLGKMLRFFDWCPEFGILVRGITNSAPLLGCSFCVIFLLLFVVSSLGIELIYKNPLNLGPEADPDFQDHVFKHFGSLPSTMGALLQFITLDGMSALYGPLIARDPVITVFFVIVILLLSILMVNLLNAVVVVLVLEQNAQEREGRRLHHEEEMEFLADRLRSLFNRLDLDRSGHLSLEEINNMNEADRDFLCETIGLARGTDIFTQLDIDQSGSITINEFVDAVFKGKCVYGTVEKGLKKQIDQVVQELKAQTVRKDLALSLADMLEEIQVVRVAVCSLPEVIESMITQLRLDLNVKRAPKKSSPNRQPPVDQPLVSKCQSPRSDRSSVSKCQSPSSSPRQLPPATGQWPTSPKSGAAEMNSRIEDTSAALRELMAEVKLVSAATASFPTWAADLKKDMKDLHSQQDSSTGSRTSNSHGSPRSTQQRQSKPLGGEATMPSWVNELKSQLNTMLQSHGKRMAELNPRLPQTDTHCTDVLKCSKPESWCGEFGHKLVKEDTVEKWPPKPPPPSSAAFSSPGPQTAVR